MANFLKSNQGSMYQISVTGRRDNRQAVITKFLGYKDWSVAYWYDVEKDTLKADEIVDGFKTLKEAKFSAECHVDV